MRAPVLLSLQNFSKHFHVNKELTIRAVDDVSFDVRKGEIFGLVGESGCGKSTVARCVMGLYPPTEGVILFRDYPISDNKIRRRHRKDIQRNLQVIFQDSAAALNPRMRVAEIIAEPFAVNGLYIDRIARKREVENLLARVGLDTGYAAKLPGELSGGQRQRVAIARSIAIRPEFIVADEPVASLDVSIQAQIVSLFQELQRERGFTFLFIAHDLSMVRYLCDRTGVMYAGKLVELAPTKELFARPRHPYTQALLSAIPIPDPVYERGKTVLAYSSPPTPPCAFREIAPGHHVLMPSEHL